MCITIEAEILLANFFGNPNFKRMQKNNVDIKTIQKSADYLANNLPGYVYVQTSKDAIDAAVNNSSFYYFDENNNHIGLTGEKIDLSQYNKVFTEVTEKQLVTAINNFFSRELYKEEKEVELLNKITA